MNKLLLALVAILLLLHPAAQAAEALPGDACNAANNLQFTSGPEVAGGGGHALLCQGGTWKSILSFNNTAALTKLGNQTCTANQILKFNGTSWACATEATGADNLGNHTATQALNMSGNTISGLGIMTGSNWTPNYDVWLQGGTSTVSGEARNLAVLGVKTTDQLYINHASEYAGGTVIGGPVMINGGSLVVNGGALNISANAVTANVGTIRDAEGGWVRTYGATGWYSQTYGGGWNMEDTTWLRAYGGKAIYTTNVARADAGIYTNQICNISGTGCVAQSALGGGGGGVPAGTMCGMATTTYYGVSECTNSAPSNAYYQSRFTCNGVNVVTTCPSGYTRTTYPSGARPCGDGDECLNCSRTCVKN